MLNPYLSRTKPIFCYHGKTWFLGTHILTVLNQYLTHTKPYSKNIFFCIWEWTAATPSFEAPLVVLQIGAGNCPIQAKRNQRRLSELLSFCWVHIWKADFWNAMHIHSDFLTTSSPAEGRVRSIGGNCSRWRMRTSCVVCFGFDGVFRLTDFDRFRNLSVWSCYMWWSRNLIHVHLI